MGKTVLVNDPLYDPLFAELIKNLESCGYSNTVCGSCPVFTDCQKLFDSLCDRKTHYRITQSEYDRFFEHFKSLKKQLTLC
jgi:hypothetical protein